MKRRRFRKWSLFRNRYITNVSYVSFLFLLFLFFLISIKRNETSLSRIARDNCMKLSSRRENRGGVEFCYKCHNLARRWEKRRVRENVKLTVCKINRRTVTVVDFASWVRKNSVVRARAPYVSVHVRKKSDTERTHSSCYFLVANAFPDPSIERLTVRPWSFVLSIFSSSFSVK